MIVEREAVRAILITPEEEVLLLRLRLPGREVFWITPGGGIEPGENVESALRRELCEELDLKGFEIGPLLWLRQHTFSWADQRFCQREQYYAVHVPRFEPRMSDAVEAEVLDRFQWWPLAELKTTSEQLTPLSLTHIVESYLMQGPPDAPPAIEVLVD